MLQVTQDLKDARKELEILRRKLRYLENRPSKFQPNKNLLDAAKRHFTCVYDQYNLEIQNERGTVMFRMGNVGVGMETVKLLRKLGHSVITKEVARLGRKAS